MRHISFVSSKAVAFKGNNRSNRRRVKKAIGVLVTMTVIALTYWYFAGNNKNDVVRHLSYEAFKMPLSGEPGSKVPGENMEIYSVLS